ncbi:MAG: OmpH family outer membrane protein [Gammaproteobacteria bacterium]|nr:OmpH family outer membrane protein [Gammaproteobacteria bacterium]
MIDAGQNKLSIIALLLGFLATVLSPAGLAEQQNLKLAYVNFVKVIERAPQAEAALKKLEAEFSPRDKSIVDLQNQIKESEDKLEKDALVLKSAERRSVERDILKMKRDLRRITQEFREDYNLRRNEELASLQKMVSRVIEEIARQEKYDLIVHEGTLYASKRVDITEKVLDRLKRETGR